MKKLRHCHPMYCKYVYVAFFVLFCDLLAHNYLRQGGYAIVAVCLLSVCVSFCLSVCLLATLRRKTSERICMKFSAKVGNG